MTAHQEPCQRTGAHPTQDAKILVGKSAAGLTFGPPFAPNAAKLIIRTKETLRGQYHLGGFIELFCSRIAAMPNKNTAVPQKEPRKDARSDVDDDDGGRDVNM